MNCFQKRNRMVMSSIWLHEQPFSRNAEIIGGVAYRTLVSAGELSPS